MPARSVGEFIRSRGRPSPESTAFDPRDLLGRGLRLEGFWLARWMAAAPLPRRLATVRKVASLMRSRVLVNDVGRAFPLDEIAEAARHSESKARGGKAWLRIADA